MYNFTKICLSIEVNTSFFMLACLHRSVEGRHVISYSVQKCWIMTTFVVALYCNRIHVSNVIKIPISRLVSQYFLFHTNPPLISCFFPLQVLYSSPSHIHRNCSFSAMFSLLRRPHNPLLMSPFSNNTNKSENIGIIAGRRWQLPVLPFLEKGTDFISAMLKEENIPLRISTQKSSCKMGCADTEPTWVRFECHHRGYSEGKVFG